MKYITTLGLTLFSIIAFSQAKTRKLPTTINHPAINQLAPYMSFDGDAIVYLSDNSDDFVLTPFFSYREGNGDWKEPQALPKSLFNRLNFVRGYTLGPDGKTLYFSTMKSPGVGGYDLWVSERKGASWSEPKNVTIPINSKAHEASATLTPDGKSIYFMRCEKMDQQSASGCKIFVAHKKSNDQWNEPEELPAIINTGNSQSPRILADSETLIFASDKLPGNKGGLDLYMTRLKNGQWSSPKALDFVNTAQDDQCVSVNGVGRYLLRDSPGARKRELVEYLIPDDLRPRGLLRVDGRVSGNSGTVSSYISVRDLDARKNIFTGRPASDGTFNVFLLEGGRYELSIDPEQSNFTFYSRRFDLTRDLPQLERVSVLLKKIEPGDELDLSGVDFKPYSSELETGAEEDLKRLARLVKSVPEINFEIQVMLAGYLEDIERSHKDLTEVFYDSVHTRIDDIDTLGQLFKKDTVIARTVFHNDRTVRQAEAIINFMKGQGVEEGRLSYFVNARPEEAEDRRALVIRARARK